MIFCVLLAVAAGLLPGAGLAADSPVQSPARPLGLSPVAPVQAAGSDDRAAGFQSKALPALIGTLNRSLAESQAVLDLSALRLDPQRLVVTVPVTPRIWFLGEGAGYRNSLLARVIAADGTGGAPMLVFPDASTAAPLGDPFGSATTRTLTAPLLAGDFVDLPVELQAGERLELDLISGGATGGKMRFSTDPALNDDGLATHTVSLLIESVVDQVVIGFEDMAGGGDLDYNDLVVAVDFGATNVVEFSQTAVYQAPPVPTVVPLPAPGALLLALIGTLVTLRRRKG